MSSAEGSVRQYSIGRWPLRLLYFLFFIIISGAFGSIGYGIYSKIKLQSVHVENEQLRANTESQQEHLDSINKEMQNIRRMADMVRSVLGIAPQQGVLGQGGSGFGEEEFDENEQDESGFEVEPVAIAEISPDGGDESPVAQAIQLRNKLKPLYEYVIEKVDELDQTPSILPVRAPVDGEKKTYWYSSGFGYRFHPLTKRREFHRGVDISTREGTHVIATADGVISQIGKDKFLGNMILIKHETERIKKTVYGHMSRFADGMHVGKAVKRGDTIGFVGNSGRSTGPHLHYGVYTKDGWVNPMDCIIGVWSR